MTHIANETWNPRGQRDEEEFSVTVVDCLTESGEQTTVPAPADRSRGYGGATLVTRRIP